MLNVSRLHRCSLHRETTDCLLLMKASQKQIWLFDDLIHYDWHWPYLLAVVNPVTRTEIKRPNMINNVPFSALTWTHLIHCSKRKSVSWTRLHCSQKWLDVFCRIWISALTVCVVYIIYCKLFLHLFWSVITLFLLIWNQVVCAFHSMVVFLCKLLFEWYQIYFCPYFRWKS